MVPEQFGGIMLRSFSCKRHGVLVCLLDSSKVVLLAGLLVSLFCFSARAASRSPLVGHWSLDEGAGAVAADGSGNGNDGILVNAPGWTSGHDGYGISFNGTDQYVAIPHSDNLDLTRALTISAWIYNQAKADSSLPASEYHIIAAKGGVADAGGSWTLAWDRKTNALSFCARPHSDGVVGCASFDTFQWTDDWHHVSGVFGDGRLSLYVNGELAAGPVDLGTNRISSNSEQLYIGGLPRLGGAAASSWHGLIDDVRAYATAQEPVQPIAESQQLRSGQRFDFSVATANEISIARGSAATVNVNTSLLSGTSRSVSFSVSGVPANVSATFSPTNCSPSCTTKLTIKAAAGSVPGNYLLTITARANNIRRRTTLSVSLVASQPQVAAPTISPNGGSFTGPVNVTLQTTTSGAAIYYTTNGTTPSQSSTQYSGPIALSNGATLKAIAVKTGSNPSTVASAAFTISGTSKLTLAWRDNSSAEESFAIERKTGSAGTFGQIAKVGANVVLYVDTSVTRGLTYCYRLRATNSSTLSPYSAEACGSVP
jgi:hypothetical protein